MPNYLKLMKSIKEPKDRHHHWAAYNEHSIQEKKLSGYDFVRGNELVDNKIPDKKDRFRRGQVYVSEEGLVRLGDLVLMQTSSENWEEAMQERRDRRKKIFEAFRQGAALANTGHLTHADYHTKVGKLPPQDERPKENR